jgi:hypothetical protein
MTRSNKGNPDSNEPKINGAKGETNLDQMILKSIEPLFIMFLDAVH